MTIHVRVVIEFEIDSEAYVAAGIEADHIGPDELDPTDFTAMAHEAIGYCDPEDNLPRWARDTMRVIGQSVEIDPLP